MGMKLSIAAKFDEQNLRAARIIAADPVRYPGLMQEWAALVVGKAAPTVRGPLFKERRAA